MRGPWRQRRILLGRKFVACTRSRPSMADGPYRTLLRLWLFWRAPPLVPKSSIKWDIDRFLEAAAKLPAVSESGRGRLIFALDATMSQQATWDIAQSVQGRMFATAAAHGGLDVQLVITADFRSARHRAS
jgi:hypothetical protein